MTTAEDYMRLALGLARQGMGYVNPNPMVGAVIVKDGDVIGRGYHRGFGGPHAERNAFADCMEDPRGATMFVTLEPCCHHGKTPPCTDAIIQSGVRSVVVGSVDPNPLVSGKGVAALRENGIDVVTGVLESECSELNEVFFHFIANRTPFVVMKYAMTMDGKIATAGGESKWITGGQARANVHRDRHRYSGVMAGVGTVIADDPLLTCRMPGGKNPVRIVCDTGLRTPVGSRVAATASQARTVIATACEDTEKHRPYRDLGCEILVVPKEGEQIDLRALATELGRRQIDSILLEGGSALNFSALRSGIVHKAQIYVAPKFFGGESAKPPIGGAGIDGIERCFRLVNRRVTPLGEDILIEGKVEYPCLQES